LSGIEFCVRDRRNQTDISRAVLLQVLAEAEESAGSQAVLTPAFLIQAIRAQSTPQGAELTLPMGASAVAAAAVVS
jgi:polyhydroxyalkanoate synthesis regulator protein